MVFVHEQYKSVVPTSKVMCQYVIAFRKFQNSGIPKMNISAIPPLLSSCDDSFRVKK